MAWMIWLGVFDKWINWSSLILFTENTHGWCEHATFHCCIREQNVCVKYFCVLMWVSSGWCQSCVWDYSLFLFIILFCITLVKRCSIWYSMDPEELVRFIFKWCKWLQSFIDNGSNFWFMSCCFGLWHCIVMW